MQNGVHKDNRVGSKKRALATGPIAEQEQQIVAEYDVLESGFCVSVHFSNGRRPSGADEQNGAWRSGVVMRTYASVYD